MDKKILIAGGVIEPTTLKALTDMQKAAKHERDINNIYHSKRNKKGKYNKDYNRF